MSTRTHLQNVKNKDPVPTEIDFEKYAADITTDMEIQNHFQQQPYNNQKNTPSETNATEMDIQADNQNTNSPGVEYLGSDASFATRDTHETLTEAEEELSIVDHNFNSTIEEMDYTSGFIDVQNGSPNRNIVRQLRHDRFTQNPYSALESPINEVTDTNNNNKEMNNNNTSAKTDMNTNNE
jgi:hypothetical protein